MSGYINIPGSAVVLPGELPEKLPPTFPSGGGSNVVVVAPDEHAEYGQAADALRTYQALSALNNPAVDPELEEEVAALRTDLTTAQEGIAEAQQSADDAAAAASTAQSTAAAAEATAQAAQVTAEAAVTTANAAKTAADKAVEDAAKLDTEVKAFESDIGTAKTDATNALQVAVEASKTAKNIESVAADALSKANSVDAGVQAATNTANDAVARAAEATSAAAEARRVADKASGDAVSAVDRAGAAETLGAAAVTAANEAKSVASAAQSTANEAKSAASTAQSTADGAKTLAQDAYNLAAAGGGGGGAAIDSAQFREKTDLTVYGNCGGTLEYKFYDAFLPITDLNDPPVYDFSSYCIQTTPAGGFAAYDASGKSFISFNAEGYAAGDPCVVYGDHYRVNDFTPCSWCAIHQQVSGGAWLPTSDKILTKNISAVAIGADACAVDGAGGDAGVAVGYGSCAGLSAVAVGTYATGSGMVQKDVAIGYRARSYSAAESGYLGQGNVVIGADTCVRGCSSVIVGACSCINGYFGSASLGAVVVGAGSAASGQGDTVVGSCASSSGDSTVIIGYRARGGATDTVVGASASTMSAYGGVVVGYCASIVGGGYENVAVGAHAGISLSDRDELFCTMGSYNPGSVVVGAAATSDSCGGWGSAASVVVGSAATGTIASVAVGACASAAAEGTVAIGPYQSTGCTWHGADIMIGTGSIVKGGIDSCGHEARNPIVGFAARYNDSTGSSQFGLVSYCSSCDTSIVYYISVEDLVAFLQQNNVNVTTLLSTYDV